MNRLNLDFSLVTIDERAAFTNSYVNQPQFIQRPLTNDELETIANYILWGRDPNTGKNAVQTKELQIATKYGTWDNDHDTESLDALIESPNFNEQQIVRNEIRYCRTVPKFSRDEVLQRASTDEAIQFRELFRRIDRLDLAIELYELKHGKRTKEIRPKLLQRFDEDEMRSLEGWSAHWTQYQYLKQRHALVELRREQFTLRDTLVNPVQLRGNTIDCFGDKWDWDADVVVLPLGTLTQENSALIFRDVEFLNPGQYNAVELKEVSQYYWTRKHLCKSGKNFDFRDVECVYQLLLMIEEMKDAAIIADTESSTAALLRTLDYYVNNARLTQLQSDILRLKCRHVRNADIAWEINHKYGKNYTANYISTIFRQKIIPLINNAAQEHEHIIENLFFPENFKQCSKCGRYFLKSTQYFVKKTRSQDGLSGHCKLCDKESREQKGRQVNK